jgi:hypothetical protein
MDYASSSPLSGKFQYDLFQYLPPIIQAGLRAAAGFTGILL